MEFSISIDDEQLEVKQKIVESDDNFTRRLIFIISALDSGIVPKRAEMLGSCFLNRILFGSTYSSDLEAEINNISHSIENDQV